MEPPPPPAPPSSAVTHHPDSVDSSPRSRNTDSVDESLNPSLPGAINGPTPAAISKLRLMCSYGGHIVPRPHDKSLCYVGGDTRIVVVDRQSSLADLTNRLSKTLHGRSNSSSPPPHQQSFTLKYQLPNEDLDSLISVTTDEDLENMIDEYERLNSVPTTNKSSRLRLFLFPSKPESASSIGSLLENSSKSEDWFLNALNGTTSGFSDSSSVNCLLGLDDDVLEMPGKARKDVEAQIESFGGVKGVGGKGSGQDIHSVPDSPMLETTSSFGSASSSPSQANLPPIRVHVEDQKAGGIEEQLSQMSVQQKQDDGGFVAMTSPSAVVNAVPVSAAAAVIGDYPSRDRVVSDDERSDQGIQMGYRRPPQQVPQQQQPPLMQPQLQQKQSTGFDLASPDSVSSDGSLTNPLSRQRPPMIYHDQMVRTATLANPIDQNNPDPSTRIQLQQQQIQDSGYLLPTDPQHTQLHQQPQFIHTGTQYIHHHPSGAVPMQSYYQMYPSQQQQQHPHASAHHPVLDQQNIVYYIPARAPQGYNLSMQQPSYNEASATARTQNVAPPSMAYNPARNVAASQTELASGMYRTAVSGNPQLVQIPSNQHQAQYVGYSQVHHPSQSVAPAQAGGANYGYEFADPSQGHVYYAQHMAPPQSAAQYQTMASNLPEAGTLLSSENIKQQVRTPQPQ